MGVETKFIIFQVLIIGPFIAGALVRGRVADTAAWYRRIIDLNLVLLEPPVILWSIWGLTLNRDVVVLPLAGLGLVTAGFVLGRAMAPALRLRDRERRTFIISSSLANHGFTMGGFLCYLMLGETGLGLSAIFIVYFMPWVFLVMFPFARGPLPARFDLRTVAAFVMTPRNMPLASALAALILQGAGVPRPDLPVPLGALAALPMALYYFALGLTVSTRGLLAYGRAQAALGIEKFVIMPALAALLIAVLSLTRPFSTVIMVQAFMPAAIYSVVAAVLYDLEVPLASSLFLVNTALFILAVLPALFAMHAWGIL